MGIAYFQTRVRAMAKLLRALNTDYGLQIAQNWDVLLMIAERLRNIADELTKAVEEAKAKDEKDRNGG